MARDAPLVLYHCHYHGLSFWCPPRAAVALQRVIERTWSRHAVRLHQTAAALRLLSREAAPEAPSRPFLLEPERWAPDSARKPDGSTGTREEVAEALRGITAATSNTALARGAAEKRRGITSSSPAKLPVGQSPSFEESILWTRSAPPPGVAWQGTAESEAVWLAERWPGPEVVPEAVGVEVHAPRSTDAASLMARLGAEQGTELALAQEPDDETEYEFRGQYGKRSAAYVRLDERQRFPTYADKLRGMGTAKRRSVLAAHPDVLTVLPEVLGRAEAEAWAASAGMPTSEFAFAPPAGAKADEAP